jgi:hypothetical protein
MDLSRSGHTPAPLLITPECDAPGCTVEGDQYTMVRCRGCGAWFCPEHIDAAAGARLVRLVGAKLKDLAYYQGICAACYRAHEPVH